MKTLGELLQEKRENPADFNCEPQTPAREIVFVGRVNTYAGQVGTHEIDRDAIIRKADEVIEDKNDPENRYAVFYK